MNDEASAPIAELSAHADTAAAGAVLTWLIAAAGRAPSGDNTQPWQMTPCLDPLAIDFYLDPARDLSPMNAGQRMALIACGAAIQNVLLLARERGYNPRLSLKSAADFSTSPQLIARITLTEPLRPTACDHAERTILERVCNRRLYDARTVSPLILAELKQATPATHGIQTHWIADPPVLDSLASFVGDADRIMFGERSMRSAFLANVRFDLPPHARATEGLPLGSLEISKAQGAGMRAIGACPDMVFRAAGGAAMFAAHARKLIRSASGLCLIAADSVADHADLRAGQALQRAWLTLTELGLAAQPMMSLLVLDNALRRGDHALAMRLAQRGAPVVVSDFHEAVRLLGLDGQPRFLLRFGYAAAPSGRMGRLGDRSERGDRGDRCEGEVGA